MNAVFVIEQGSGILAEQSAWPWLTILPEDSYATGFLPAVVSVFVTRQGLCTLADLPTWVKLVILTNQVGIAGF